MLRNLVRTGGSVLILVTIMLGGGLVLWVGVPVAWLYIGSRVQGSTQSVGAALAVMMVGVPVSIVTLVAGLAWLNRKHVELREARGLESEGPTPLEAIMTVSVLVALIAFVVWFFVVEGPGPSLAPRE